MEQHKVIYTQPVDFKVLFFGGGDSASEDKRCIGDIHYNFRYQLLTNLKGHKSFAYGFQSLDRISILLVKKENFELNKKLIN